MDTFLATFSVSLLTKKTNLLAVLRGLKLSFLPQRNVRYQPFVSLVLILNKNLLQKYYLNRQKSRSNSSHECAFFELTPCC